MAADSEPPDARRMLRGANCAFAGNAFMHGKSLALGVAAAIFSAAIGLPVLAADSSASNSAATLAPADANTPTAPSSDLDDTRVTAQIHAALAADRSLSPLAQNVTIATNKQAVVLRGSVLSQEKDRIESLAAQFAGTRQVVDQLLVKDL
jgi:osmotically-inducible protein OsmY